MSSPTPGDALADVPTVALIGPAELAALRAEAHRLEAESAPLRLYVYPDGTAETAPPDRHKLARAACAIDFTYLAGSVRCSLVKVRATFLGLEEVAA